VQTVRRHAARRTARREPGPRRAVRKRPTFSKAPGSIG
jgi:hypothetical protein